MLFINISLNIVRLGFWQQDTPGLSKYIDLDVPAGKSIPVPLVDTMEWHISAENFARLGKFGLGPVYCDKIGYCSPGVVRGKTDDGYTWVWEG